MSDGRGNWRAHKRRQIEKQKEWRAAQKKRRADQAKGGDTSRDGAVVVTFDPSIVDSPTDRPSIAAQYRNGA